MPGLGVYPPSPGMVYPALAYLEETGKAGASAEGTKKLYSITAEGTAYLAKNREVTDDIWRRLALFGRRLAHWQRQYAEEEVVANHFVSGSSSAGRSEKQQKKTKNHNQQDELK